MGTFKNTAQKGSVRTIIFREGRTWYGVALEFNIVESGNDPRNVSASLLEAITGYIESVKKAKERPFALNQKPDKEYEKLWGKLEKKTYRSVRSPYEVYAFGRQMIAA
jgi:hypothetical protein